MVSEEYKKTDTMYTISELLQQLDNPNPIILYKALMIIGNNHIADIDIVNKLFSIKLKLDVGDKMLGYYKIGHLAMGVLLQLGVDKNTVFTEDVDEFDRQTVIRFCNECNW